MSNPFVAEIRIFAGNFAPTGWALCNGQLLPISQNTALFSLLGTFYGGDGKSTFALPNLQGSVPIHQGQGPGLSPRFLGESSGSQTVTLIDSETPIHTHSMTAFTLLAANIKVVSDQVVFAKAAAGGTVYTNGASNTTMAPQMIAPFGGSLPHDNMPPYLTLTFIIALQGVFPPRG